MAIIHDSPSMKPEPQTSAPQNTAVGSGSRPTMSKIKIETSAPEDPKTLGRKTPGALE
jgi:hypothetical protein